MAQGKRPVRNPNNTMVTDSQSVTATQSEPRASTKARRSQKGPAKERAKREAERSNSGKSPCRVLMLLALTIETSVGAGRLTHQAQGIQPPKPLTRLACIPSKRCLGMTMSQSVIPPSLSRTSAAPVTTLNRRYPQMVTRYVLGVSEV